MTNITQRLYRRPALLVHYLPLNRKLKFSSSVSSRSEQVERIAVIGGGMTGLTAAFYASRRYPSASISLFESSTRFGGAVESVHVPVSNGTTVVCERGPRTLRANAPRAPVTYDLIDALGLAKTLIAVPKLCSTASRRYILFPDHLVSVPAFNPSLLRRHVASIPAPSVLQLRQLIRLLCVLATEPLFAGLLGGLLRSFFSSEPRPQGLHDESIGSFLSRHLGHRLVDNFASAVINGLYAGDIYRLSAKALLPGLWEIESKAQERRHGALYRFTGTMFPSINRKTPRLTPRHASDMSLAAQSQRREDEMVSRLRKGPSGELETSLKDITVFSFRRGLGELPSALETYLASADNVELHAGARVQKIIQNDTGLELSISNRGQTSTETFTHVIATTPYNHIISAANLDLEPMHTATAMLVTLYFATPNLNHPHRGFGYLIPNSVPLHQNPEHALGVVFDTDAMPGQDQAPHHGTKITVILGGHWWRFRSATSFPTEADGVTMARRLLHRHLDISEDPVATLVTLQRDAIPQYEIGHCERMARLRAVLNDRFAGRLRVAGASYRGIGVHDCVFSARSVVEGLDVDGWTGLECFEGGN
ncbi:hypothetical protein M426DRAFT_15943 [Hypoxylon sp. CI-4A]|nr:hypothetical protein M426DRAFT_15943 [Hypoxylon sp. CI-4A]